MGTTLGLIGAGGSILTVPILVYFFKISPLSATAYSLLIVGFTALFGAFFYYRRNLVKIKSALTFAVPATISVFCTRAFILPNLPNFIAKVPKDNFIMLLFAVLMMIAAFFVAKSPEIKVDDKKSKFHKIITLVFGSALIGLLTGMVGAGGGFLIIPALIILFNLKAKEAIGTSLAIIAINSLIGFFGDVIKGFKPDFEILTTFLFATIAGMSLGILLNKKIDGQGLKNIFAIFIMIVAILIFASEINQLIKL